MTETLRKSISNIPRLQRSNTLRERRSTSQSNVAHNECDSDDSCSVYSVPSSKPLRRRFTLHCDRGSRLSIEDTNNYLTPTQRYEKQIRQLRIALRKSARHCDDKEKEIERLVKILRANGIDAGQSSNVIVTVIDEETTVDRRDLCDSGVVTDESSDGFAYVELLANEHENELRKLKDSHSDDVRDMREKHNSKVESLLQRISEINARHCDLREMYDKSQDTLRELEKQIDKQKQTIDEKEKYHQQMYVKMYRKGQEAAKFEHADDVMIFAEDAPDRVAVPELVQQLRLAEHELDRIKRLYQREVYNHRNEHPNDKDNGNVSSNANNKPDGSTFDNLQSEITLNFLRDVVYHYFTDRDHSCSEGHLRALISILGYNEIERRAIEKGVKKKRRIV
ncbi:Uncharacterised protein r2_g954 [Pycnogonum litorale]